MRHITGAIIAILLFATAAFAQTATVTKDAPIYVQQNPTGALPPLRVAAVGTILKVVGEEGEWIQVQFQDPQWGLRTGWVKLEFLKIARPELEPMDLSIKPQPAPAEPPHQIRDSIPRAVTEGEPQGNQPQSVTGKIPRAYKIWSGVLFGLGAYYFFSAAVVDPNGEFCIGDSCVSNSSLRKAWIVMGTALSATGTLVLAKGIQKSHRPVPTVTLGPNHLAVHLTLNLPYRR